MYDSGMDATNRFDNDDDDDEHKKTEAYGANRRERAKERVSFECG